MSEQAGRKLGRQKRLSADHIRKLEENAPRTGRPYITLEQFREIEAALLARGYGDMINWSENVEPPRDCGVFAREAIYVICNGGMRVAIANAIFRKCMRALRRRRSVMEVYGHPGKAAAIDHIWAHRKVLFEAYKVAKNKIAFLETLPWIGPTTRYHLAKNLSLNVVKPDVHIMRLAKGEGSTARRMCERLAILTGYRAATIDVILWRACADGFLNSKEFGSLPWNEVFNPLPPPR
ncbi:hypothetical protein FPZ24_01970 [Sphingomonas panacisoli]|uniref:HhH-GPD domain-containing protein n=1 Tax=Sphingomonas panacisoli TaxID=1813879 RepID=A0A5B8LE91_9SPHN|nr:hypothetical protein [Sphingomonas panacisoli]QDZ06391.1 hypothetical protein FPZ24_01970 [Sphingomonas panacisoli]